MRAFALVLLVAASAFAAPSITVRQTDIAAFNRLPDDGRPMNRAVMGGSFGVIDAGDTSVYTNTVQQIMEDLADIPDGYCQAIASAQAMAMLGELASGQAGDSCAAAAAVNSFAEGGSAASFSSNMNQYAGFLFEVAKNPWARRFASGPAGGCVGGGRTYAFEAAWDLILARAPPVCAGLLDENYCALKRLYSANSKRSNNLAAAATAAAAMASQGIADVGAYAGVLRKISY